jgi:holo-[acyl-carrier-protein] synthase
MMIYGVGIDSCEIDRIKKSLKNKLFFEKVFGEKEKKELILKKMNPQNIAACFCAKEAFSKAMGTGIRGFKFVDVQMLHHENGKPYLELSNNAKELREKNNLVFNVSVTHTKQTATVIVISEKRG